MGRAVNEATITTRNARTKLNVAKTVHWRAIDRGSHLGYRKGKDGGTWVARFRRDDRKYVTKAIGTSDDTLEADGIEVLSHSQALTAARKWCEEQAKEERGTSSTPNYTVGDALREYLEWFAIHRKSLGRTKNVIDSHILPQLGRLPITKLTADRIRKWHEKLATTPPRVRSGIGKSISYRQVPDDLDHRRKRKVSANKALNSLRAALNLAFREGRTTSDIEWKRVKPFRNVDDAKVRFLDGDECRRLIGASDPDFRQLLEAALFTGCRYGELTALRCQDFNADSGTIFIQESKSGKPRHVPLNDEGLEFFSNLSAGRDDGELVFQRADGKQWGRSHQKRRMDAAAAKAGLRDVSFHILRHTYGSALAMQGVPMGVIAAALGHADTRITEKHYAALAPNYVAETIRAHLPKLKIEKKKPK